MADALLAFLTMPQSPSVVLAHVVERGFEENQVKSALRKLLFTGSIKWDEHRKLQASGQNPHQLYLMPK